MTLIFKNFILGPIENNTYLIADSVSREAALIDPSIPSREVLDEINKSTLSLKYLLITHAHFDHVGGVKWFKTQFEGKPQILLHQADLPLWDSGGGARDFEFDFETGIRPDFLIEDKQALNLGSYQFNVLHTPGHTPGHVTFFFLEDLMAFCGDLIFFHGVGRTDLKYSNSNDLNLSIKHKIFSLPENTRLLPGHGASTTVLEEKLNNPFVS